MATPMTLREEKFARLLRRYETQCSIYKIPAPNLVEIVEHGQVDTRKNIDMLQRLFIPYRGRLDALVLGWTRRRLQEAGLLREGPGEILIENSLPSKQILELSWRLLGSPKRQEK